MKKDPNKNDENDRPVQLENIDTMAAFRHPNRDNWKLGVEYMRYLAEIDFNANSRDQNHTVLIHQAQYNLGKAYFQGFGIKQSDQMAEKWWLQAADDGSQTGCVGAMTAIAFFYSRKSDPEYFDLSKAFYWHNEACGNGSLESQG